MTSQQTFTCSKSTKKHSKSTSFWCLYSSPSLLTLNRKMFIWIASSDYETISIYINFFQICNRASLSSTRTSYINVWNNKHWNVSEGSNCFVPFRVCYMKNKLACLERYPTHLDVSDMSNLFCFHFVFTWSRAMTRLLNEIQFCQPDEMVMRMLMYQFKLTKS